MHSSSFLRDGYAAFRRGQWKKHKKRFQALAGGQSPKAMVIGCSDSRVDPAMIFDAGPGDLFIVRNVANLVPPPSADGENSAGAALEYAVTALGIEHILILGHSGCGGVKACLDSHPGEGAGDSCVARWIANLSPARARVLEAHGDAPREVRQRALEEEGIRQSIRNVKDLPFVRVQMAEGRLSVHGGWFDIGTATLYAMDGTTGQFLPM